MTAQFFTGVAAVGLHWTQTIASLPASFPAASLYQSLKGFVFCVAACVCVQFYRDYDRALNTYMGSEGIGMDLTLVRVFAARWPEIVVRLPSTTSSWSQLQQQPS
jgi:hypothetical protein